MRYLIATIRLNTVWIVILVLGFICVPLTVVQAQQEKKVFRIGYLGASSSPRSTSLTFQALMQGMRDLGYIEGQNLIVEYRKADGQPDRLPELAAELVRLPVDIILTAGPEAALRAASQATRTIPIVMMAINFDPLAKGYIASLDRPGGNITGIFYIQLALSAKRMELFKKALPEITRVFALYDVYSADQLKPTEEAARSLGLQLQSLELRDPPYDFESAMTTAVQARAEALIVLSSPQFFSQRIQLTALMVEHRLPGIFLFSYYVELGGLMSYGANSLDMFKYAATYMDKILKGANPGDLPVEQPTKFEFVINQKTAKQIGVTIPPLVLFQADKVIQ